MVHHYPHPYHAAFRIIDHFSAGKNQERNEDVHFVGADRLILSDGATDKNGFRHQGKTGGELAALAVVAACRTMHTPGRELVQAATAAIHAQYEEFNREALTDSARRYGATLADARLVSEEAVGVQALVLTLVGDSGARVITRDGTVTLLQETKRIDAENAAQRAAYIRKHPDDIEGGRAVIMERLREQHRLQNVPLNQNEYGYGVIDGTPVPDEFIKVYRFPADQVDSVELFSDGYSVIPEAVGLDAFEAALQRQRSTDPHAIGEAGYPAQTKTADDRTYLLAQISSR